MSLPTPPAVITTTMILPPSLFPSLYLRDWPDIYIHTDHDTLSQIDATKLRRIALLGAAAGYVYANVDAEQLPALLPAVAAQSLGRLAQSFKDAQNLVNDPQLDPNAAWYESRNLLAQAGRRELSVIHSLVDFTAASASADTDEATAVGAQLATYNRWIDSAAKRRGAKGATPVSPWASEPEARRVPVRIGEFGPLTYQNDNVLLARLGKDRYSKIKLLDADATQLLKVTDQSELYAYEIANFVDSKRSAGEIRDAVAAEYGPLPVSLVVDYLNACVEAKVLQWK